MKPIVHRRLLCNRISGCGYFLVLVYSQSRIAHGHHRRKHLVLWSRCAALPNTSLSLGCIDKRRVVAKEFIVPVHSQKRPRRMHIVARISPQLP